MAVIQGAANTPITTKDTLGFNTTTTILERDVGPAIFYVDPSASPFTLLTSRSGDKPAHNPRFEWYEKDLRPKIDAINAGGGYTAGDTALTVDNALTFQVNDVVLVARTGETMRVASIAAPVITVVRGTGETSAAALVDNDDLFVIGSAWREGADAGIPDEWQEVQKFNFTEIFRRPFGVSRTRQGTSLLVGDNPRSQLRAEKAIEHAIDIERAFMFGERAEFTTGETRRQTRGFNKWATSNVKDVSGTLTENELEDWLADVFDATSAGDSRLLLASAKVCSVFDQLAAGRLQMVPSDKTYGIAVSQYQTSHGSLNIVKHRLMESGTKDVLAGERAWAIDPKMLTMRTFVNGRTKLRTDVQVPGVDGWIDEYLTETGLQFKVPAVHGVLKNVTA